MLLQKFPTSNNRTVSTQLNAPTAADMAKILGSEVVTYVVSTSQHNLCHSVNYKLLDIMHSRAQMTRRKAGFRQEKEHLWMLAYEPAKRDEIIFLKLSRLTALPSDRKSRNTAHKCWAKT